jgi:haloalkane dehalogenase
MRRRQFLGVTGGALASGAIAGCAWRLTRNGGGLASGSALVTMSAADFHRAHRFAATRFGNIAYIDRGTGPVALFLHGFPLNGFQWRGAIDHLQAQRRCIAPDFMGLGYTEVAEGQGVAPRDQVAMLAALLDALSVTSVDLIANDSGGAVAQLFVTRFPDRVRTLLLTNCDVETDSPPPALTPVIELSKAGTFADQWLLPWLKDAALARSPEGIGGMCYVDPSHPTDVAIETYFGPLLSSPHKKAMLHAYALGLERNPLTGIASALGRSRVPTRILWGTGDTIFSQASPAYLDRVLGSSRGVRRLEGRKLFFPEEVPDIVAEEARRLWTS